MLHNIARLAALLLMSVLAWAGQAHAQSTATATLEIENPYLRAPPPSAPTAGGYVVIRNTGDEADRLIAIVADFAAMAQLHSMSMVDGVMKMRHLADGLEVPPASAVVLEPGGHHLMFMQLDGPLLAGESRTAVLQFEKAGDIAVEFIVVPFGAKAPEVDNGGDS